jgi:hypothetical protein
MSPPARPPDPSLFDTAASGRGKGGCDGVGSNSIQPYCGKYTSTHACASCSRTTYALAAESNVPVVNPSTSRAGTPTSRSMTTMAEAKYSQKSCFRSNRK